MVTFAILGHNEAPNVARAVELARAAAQSGDDVLFVDSASTDGSSDAALGAGARLLRAPLGKGRAFRELYRCVQSRWLVCMDADVLDAQPDLAVRLRAACSDEHLMVVGEFEDDAVLSNTWAIYEPLEAGLFPEIAGRLGSRPLSGFRTVRCGLDLGTVPPGFGLEAHLNVTIGSLGKVGVTELGPYRGPFRYKPTMGREIGDGVLDAAVELGRLDPGRRPAFDAWVDEAVEVIASYRGHAAGREEFVTMLDGLAARPLPH